MKTATVRQVRNAFPTLLRRVEKGEVVTITRRGKTVAALTPPPRKAAKQPWARRAEELAELFPVPLKGRTMADLISEDRD
jgi:prevent-host-death family protein